jgi:ATP-dependent helicase/nuclease subunit A
MPIELREAGAVELNRDRAEAIRVAYVATTRARDLLVLPVCGAEPIHGWFEVLNPALYPRGETRRNSQVASGCPTFGEHSVLRRGLRSVRPRLHKPTPDGASVVWWDPSILALEVEELATLRHQRILQIDPDGAAAAASEQNYSRWKKGREDLLSRGAQPSLSVQTVTSLAGRTVTQDDPENGIEVLETRDQLGLAVEQLDRGDLQRPGGRRFAHLFMPFYRLSI